MRVGICALFFTVRGLMLHPPAYAPVLLQRKAHKIRKELAPGDPEKGGPKLVKTVYQIQKGEASWREFLVRALCRPFVLFAQEPIIQLFGVYLAFVYGTVYCASSPTLFIRACGAKTSFGSGAHDASRDLHGRVPRGDRHRGPALHFHGE